jgi:hypothetical protein
LLTSVTAGLSPVLIVADPGDCLCRVAHWTAPRMRPPMALPALSQDPLAKPTRFWIFAM